MHVTGSTLRVLEDRCVYNSLVNFFFSIFLFVLVKENLALNIMFFKFSQGHIRICPIYVQHSGKIREEIQKDEKEFKKVIIRITEQMLIRHPIYGGYIQRKQNMKSQSSR